MLYWLWVFLSRCVQYVTWQRWRQHTKYHRQTFFFCLSGERETERKKTHILQLSRRISWNGFPHTVFTSAHTQFILFLYYNRIFSVTFFLLIFVSCRTRKKNWKHGDGEKRRTNNDENANRREKGIIEKPQNIVRARTWFGIVINFKCACVFFVFFCYLHISVSGVCLFFFSIFLSLTISFSDLSLCVDLFKLSGIFVCHLGSSQ